MVVHILQAAMSGGEISPLMAERYDLARRSLSVAKAENFLALVTGAMQSRPGFQFIANTKSGSDLYRLIEFEFSASQTYVLELGEYYMRFHTNGAQIVDSTTAETITGVTQASPGVITATGHSLVNGDEVFITGIVGMTELNGGSFLVANAATNTFELTTLDGVAVDTSGFTAYSSGGTATKPYELTTPWPASILREIRYDQSGNTMTLCHENYAPRELVRTSATTWTLSEVALVPQQTPPTNIGVDVQTTIDTDTISAITQADPCVVTTAASHNLETGDLVRISGIVGMVELNNHIFSVTNLSATTVSLAWFATGTDVNSTGYTAYSSGGSMEHGERPRSYTVTAISGDGEESLPGLTNDTVSITNITQADPCVVTTAEGHGLLELDRIEINSVGGMTELNGKRFEISVVDATSFSLRTLDGLDLDSTGLTAYTSGGTLARTYVLALSSADDIVPSGSDPVVWHNRITWTEASGASVYTVYASDNFGLLGFLGETTRLVFEDIHLNPDFAVSSPDEFNPFEDIPGNNDKFPAAVAYYQQRRIFASTVANPNRFFMSKVAAYNNFTSGSPPSDADAIIASIAARKINSIEHILPLTSLLMLTSGAEYRIATEESGTLTPSLNPQPQTYYGSSTLRPLVSGNVGLFKSVGEVIRDMSYEFASDKFEGQDITVLSRHLFDGYSIVDWAFSTAPYSCAFCVRDDGVGLVLTYKPDQEVFAWTRATTAGKFKSCTTVREGEYDRIYVAVERTVGGYTKTYIERMDLGLFSNLEDAFCVDAGLSYDNSTAITGMTAASPVVVTSAGHGLSDGDTVDIFGVMEATTDNTIGEVLSTGYNGTGFTVANATANTFELQNVGTDYDGSSFAAYASGGEVRKAATTFSNLWHLEGGTVVAAANGYVEKGLTVSNGQITLSTAASKVHAGLAYRCTLQTLPIALINSQRLYPGLKKNITHVLVHLHQTRGLWLGTTDDDMREAIFSQPEQYGQPPPFFSGVKDISQKAGWNNEKAVQIEQRDPLPATVLAVNPEVTPGGG